MVFGGFWMVWGAFLLVLVRFGMFFGVFLNFVG